jgi:hypothetical protein
MRRIREAIQVQMYCGIAREVLGSRASREPQPTARGPGDGVESRLRCASCRLLSLADSARYADVPRYFQLWFLVTKTHLPPTHRSETRDTAFTTSRSQTYTSLPVPHSFKPIHVRHGRICFPHDGCPFLATLLTSRISCTPHV